MKKPQVVGASPAPQHCPERGNLNRSDTPRAMITRPGIHHQINADREDLPNERAGLPYARSHGLVTSPNWLLEISPTGLLKLV